MNEPPAGRTTHKFAVVLNKKIEPGTALTACAHMTATLVARADSETRKHMSFMDYLDANGNVHPVSALSLVVLSAKNSQPGPCGTARGYQGRLVLQGLVALDEDAELGAAARGDHQGGRSGQAERARAGDDQHGQRGTALRSQGRT